MGYEEGESSGGSAVGILVGAVDGLLATKADGLSYASLVGNLVGWD